MIVVGDVAARLAAAGCVAADEEADELVAAAPDDATLERWVRRREAGEPLPWIIGALTFCGRRVRVDPGVYVPRLQTEELARRAAAALPAGGTAVDLCTGAGAVAVHLAAAMPSAMVIAVDLDPRAARCAGGNGVRVVVGDLDEPIAAHRTVDVVTAVPPYVPTHALRVLPADVQRYEPRAALDGGDDGLDVARRVVAAAGRLLRSGGRLFLEVGGDQDALLEHALAAAGLVPDEPWYDDDGDLRGLSARRRRG